MAFLSLFWWIPALLTSVFQACFQTANQFYKLPGIMAAFWRSFVPFVIMWPIVFWIPFPDDPIFYYSLCSSAFFASYIDVKFMDGAKRFGGGIVTRIISLAPIISFFVWFVFRPELINTYLSQPLWSGLLLFVLFMVVTILFRLKECEYNREAILHLLPALICMGIAPLFNKNAMDHSPLLSGLVYYIWLQGGAMSVILLTAMIIKGDAGALIESRSSVIRRLFSRKTIVYGVMIAVYALLFLGTKSYTYTLVEHPVYVSIVQRLSAIWVIVFYQIIHHKEKGDVRSGLVLVLLAAIFIAIESQIKY